MTGNGDRDMEVRRGETIWEGALMDKQIRATCQNRTNRTAKPTYLERSYWRFYPSIQSTSDLIDEYNK